MTQGYQTPPSRRAWIKTLLAAGAAGGITADHLGGGKTFQTLQTAIFGTHESDMQQMGTDLRDFLTALGNVKMATMLDGHTRTLDGELREYYTACFTASRDAHGRSDSSYGVSPETLEAQLSNDYAYVLQPSTDAVTQRMISGTVIENLLKQIRALAELRSDKLLPLSREIAFGRSEKGLSALLSGEKAKEAGIKMSVRTVAPPSPSAEPDTRPSTEPTTRATSRPTTEPGR